MKLGDNVRVLPLEVRGRVVALFTDSEGDQIRVRFLWEGDTRYTYFYPEELEVL